MRISRIYYDGGLELGNMICLPIETSHYITNVLRLTMASPLTLFNGEGKEYQAKVCNIQRKNVIVAIEESIYKNVESPINIHLAQAVSRSEKMDWVIQKAVELGVRSITPLVTEFCSVKLSDDRMTKKLWHWKKVIISACEQSGRNFLPELHGLQHIEDWLKLDHQGSKIYCHPRASHSIMQLDIKGQIAILIGPEGGLSEEEITMADAFEFEGVSLGPRILRTETAALAIISIVQGLWGDLKF